MSCKEKAPGFSNGRLNGCLYPSFQKGLHGPPYMREQPQHHPPQSSSIGMGEKNGWLVLDHVGRKIIRALQAL